MNDYPIPAHRRLQVFSLDPAADIQLEKALISRSVLNVRWEEVEPGPIGEYIEVIDYDPPSGCVYDPINLDQTLATDGLEPSTGNPQFHQQMVYAVAMQTITNFERILGRSVLWAERYKDENGEYISLSKRYIRRLRIYPHALRDQNAYYSPAKNALLFGYFNAPTTDPRDELPGGMVFTCLSHDIIAHETTHAILHGIHRRLLQPSNHDMLAFHEAFADIVAIFQHFTLPGLLVDQIQATRGQLDQDNLLAQLASQFARATGRGNALRNALDSVNIDGNSIRPEPSQFEATLQPHKRGAILVAAIFDAFLRIYRNRVADLKRISTNGTGVLPEGQIHPDLTARFAEEATKAAQRVLSICIRAIDYLPPVDMTMGDYLRALITADSDLNPDDPNRYRLAFIESFRDRGIYPLDVRTLAEDALRWKRTSNEEAQQFRDYLPSERVLRTMTYAYDAGSNLKNVLYDAKSQMHTLLRNGKFVAAEQMFLQQAWITDNLKPITEDRRNQFLLSKVFAVFLHGWIMGKARQEKRNGKSLDTIGWFLGLDIDSLRKEASNIRGLEVHAVRPTVRIRADGRPRTQLLVILTQSRWMDLQHESGKAVQDTIDGPLSFKYRGGTTLIIDPDQGIIEYSISKSLHSKRRALRHATFLRDQVAQSGHAAVSNLGLTPERYSQRDRLEPLASLHNIGESEGCF